MADDCELVRLSGHPTIVTNLSYRLCPWADVLFGMDSVLWAAYHKEIDAAFHGAKLSMSSSNRYGATTLAGQTWFRGFGNSGTCAISLAVVGGASRIILLGFDCQKTGGQVHWHPDFPRGFGNGKSMRTWPAKFASVAAYAKGKGCRVVNCSRASALECFERGTLENELLVLAALGG